MKSLMTCLLIFIVIFGCRSSTKKRNDFETKSTTGLIQKLTKFLPLVDGGYENLVAVGTAQDEQGQEVTIIFGGGNHATGDKLGATFPWTNQIEAGVFDEVAGVGFNDMTVAIIDSHSKTVLNYADPFETKKLTPAFKQSAESMIPALLDICWVDKNSPQPTCSPGAEPRESLIAHFRLGFDEERMFRQIPATSQKRPDYPLVPVVKVRFELNVQNHERFLEPNGLKKICPLCILDDVERCTATMDKLFGDKFPEQICKTVFDNKSYGLYLSEYPFILDETKPSKLVITNIQDETERVYTLKSLIGGLERSLIKIIPDYRLERSAMMQYDYISLHPADPQKCGAESFIGYVSGTLNRKYSTFAKILHESGMVNKLASAGFFVGLDSRRDVNIRELRKIKAVDDIENISELGLSANDEYYWIEMKVGPGIFDRRIVELTGANDCKWYGMLETQRLPKTEGDGDTTPPAKAILVP